jgi:prepilin-type N-terminal cleavage/methylation domain-containing protein
MKDRTGRTTRARNDQGFTILQMLVVLAIVAILSGLAVMGVESSRSSIRLQNSMRLLAGRLEKARLDALRRHGSSLVEFTSNNTYAITMDFDGTGNSATQRTFRLEEGVVLTNADGTAIATADLPSIDFGWRGGTPQCFTSIRMKNSRNDASTIAVSSTGDITIDTNLGETVSPGSYSTVSQSNDVSSDATVAGTGAVTCEDPCGTCGAVSTGTVPSSPPPGCTVFTLNKSAITIKKNGASSDTFKVTVTNADTITVTQPDGRTNLLFSPSSQAVGVGASKFFTVSSKNNSKGKFTVKFTSACSPSNTATATVTVTN